jgi:hypothetical protein
MARGDGRADRSRGGPRGPGGSLWDDNGQFNPPNAQYYAWGDAPGYGYGSSPAAWGGGGSGGGSAPASAGGVPWPDGLDDAGNEIAPVSAGSSGAAAGGASSVFTRLVERYGASAVSGAVEAYLKQHETEATLDERRQEANQRTALNESTLDPFRGYMAQASDLSHLDLMDHDYTASPLQLDAKYGAGLNLPPSQSYAPSALTRQVLASARSSIAGGNTAPTLTNPSNYGALPVVHASQAPPSTAPQAPNSTGAITTPASSVGTQPLPRILTSATPTAPSVTAAAPPGNPSVMGSSQRRRWPWEDDANSPWLQPQ